MIECPSCGMPVKQGAQHCSACGEPITAELTRRAEVKRTTELDQAVLVDEPIPPTAHFGKSNGEPLVQTCLRCNSVLNPAAQFCSVCGRATEASAFERTVDATRTARQRAVAALRRAVSNVREHPQERQEVALIPIVCLALAALCFLFSLYCYPVAPANTSSETLAEMIRSVWWLALAALWAALAAFFKR